MHAKTQAANPWSQHSPDRHWDYIVIGSGMGGMTTAAMLAHFGRQVLVIEQHEVPGGFTHTFSRPGYRWDIGVHAVGEVTMHTLTGRILADLSGYKLKWQPLGPLYDDFVFPDGLEVSFPDNPTLFRERLAELFPDETEAIEGYFALVKQVANAMKGYFFARAFPVEWAFIADLLFASKALRYLKMRTREVVDGLTEDPRLRTLLTAQWGYYGSTPSRSSFAVQALVSKHFLHGSFYPIGGTGQIAQTLLQTVADAGGWTRVATHVEEIVVDNNTAKGVVLTTGERILADRVVSAVGVSSTVHSLLPEKYRETKWARSIEDLAPGPSHISLYVGFKGDIRRAGAGKANKWIYQTWSQEQDTWNISDPDHLPNPPILYVSFSSLKDPDYDPGPDELHTGEIVTFVKWEDFKQWRANWKQRPEAYETFVTKLRDKLLADFLAHMPELEPMVAYVEISTPASSEHFCRPVAGSIYGIEPTPDRFRNKWLRPRSPITNLLFAGSEVATGGLIGAMMGGVLAATSAEPLTALRYFKDVL